MLGYESTPKAGTTPRKVCKNRVRVKFALLPARALYCLLVSLPNKILNARA